MKSYDLLVRNNINGNDTEYGARRYSTPEKPIVDVDVIEALVTLLKANGSKDEYIVKALKTLLKRLDK